MKWRAEVKVNKMLYISQDQSLMYPNPRTTEALLKEIPNSYQNPPIDLLEDFELPVTTHNKLQDESCSKYVQKPSVYVHNISEGQKTMLYCNNKSAISVTKNDLFYVQNKHIDI